jgi:hypothetical protein
VCLDAAAQLHVVSLIAALPVFVRLSSERVRQAVPQDCSFAEKQASPLRSWSSSAAGAPRTGTRALASAAKASAAFRA